MCLLQSLWELVTERMHILPVFLVCKPKKNKKINKKHLKKFLKSVESVVYTTSIWWNDILFEICLQGFNVNRAFSLLSTAIVCPLVNVAIIVCVRDFFFFFFENIGHFNACLLTIRVYFPLQFCLHFTSVKVFNYIFVCM